jgi:hypothetical protein
MKSIFLKLLLCLGCLFSLQLARAQDATANATDSGTASQPQTNSASYDDTMKWIKSKLETWAVVRQPWTYGELFVKYRITQFDVSGNLELTDQVFTNNTFCSEEIYKFNLSNITSVGSWERCDKSLPGAHWYLVSLHSPQLIECKINGIKSDGVNDMWLNFVDQQSAERIASAFRHAIKLVKEKEPKEPF